MQVSVYFSTDEDFLKRVLPLKERIRSHGEQKYYLLEKILNQKGMQKQF